MVNSLLERIDRLLPRNLQVKISLLVTGLLFILISLISVLFSDFTEATLREQIGRKAVEVAHSVALNPIVQQGLKSSSPADVQRIAEEIRRRTDAEFVVVGDRRGIRLSHPDPEKIGRPFVGGDIGPALQQGQSYASQSVGTLGPSLRGIVPVKDAAGSILGFVAVGYLLSDIDRAVTSKRREIYGYVAVVLLFGIFGAAVIATGLKSAIFGLDPHEIAALFLERNAIIGAIREGIIAVDGDGSLTTVNQTARAYLARTRDENLRGLPLKAVCCCPALEKALDGGQQILDREMTIAGRTMIVNLIPLPGNAQGAVASFRPKDELDRLSRELTRMQEYSEMLRAQTHEHSNKLHTIAGLIQIGAHQEALELVMTEASGYQDLIRSLTEAVPDPLLAGIILGKFNRARELKINFALDPGSSLADIPPHLNREHLVTILGNLLDNAFEAVREFAGEKKVRLFLTDLGTDLIVEVEDSGPGVAEEVAQSLFDKGVTTKGRLDRGMGLYLVRQALDALGGEITFARSALGGALFTAIVPKNRQQEKREDK